MINIFKVNDPLQGPSIDSVRLEHSVSILDVLRAQHIVEDQS